MTEARSTVAFTQRGMIVFTLLLGLVLALLVLLGAFVVIQFSNQQQINTRNIKQLDAVTADLKALLDPSPQQYNKQLRDGLKRCLASRRCRRLFPEATREAARARRARAGRPVQPGTQPSMSGGESGQLPSQGGSDRDDFTPGGGGKTGGGGDSSPPAPSSPDPAPAPTPTPAPAPPRPVDVNPGGPVRVCTPLVGVNCD